jgi:hypothetical protein
VWHKPQIKLFGSSATTPAAGEGLKSCKNNHMSGRRPWLRMHVCAHQECAACVHTDGRPRSTGDWFPDAAFPEAHQNTDLVETDGRRDNSGNPCSIMQEQPNRRGEPDVAFPQHRQRPQRWPRFSRSHRRLTRPTPVFLPSRLANENLLFSRAMEHLWQVGFPMSNANRPPPCCIAGKRRLLHNSPAVSAR